MKRILLALMLLILPGLSFATTYEVTTPGNNVGIGSANPGTALDVTGTVRATSFIAGAGSATITGDSNGNVGINQATPGAQLDVNGSLKITAFQLSTSPTNNYVLTSDASGNGTWKISATSSQWTTANTNDVYLPNNGNVAIGTTATTLAQLVVQKVGSTDFLHVNKSVGDGGLGMIFTNAGNLGVGTINPGTAIDTNGTIRSTASGVSSFTGGNVGIGTGNAPLDLVDIAGAVSIGTTNATYHAAPTNGLIVQGNTSIGTFASNSTLTVAGGVSIGTTSAATANGLQVLGNVSIGTGTTSSNALTVYSPAGNSNVSIGTTAAANNALSVSGAVSIGTTSAATVNGLQVLGNVSIGTGTTSSNALTVYMPASNSNVSIGTTATAGSRLSVIGGNVGIGTATAPQALYVVGSGQFTTGIYNLAGTTGAIICLTATGQQGHCTAAASCTSTCTCTCTAN